jgi:cytochrome c
MSTALGIIDWLTAGPNSAIRTILGGPCGRRKQSIQEEQMRRALAAAVGIVISTGAALAQDIAAGESSFRKCAPCHSIGPDASNKVGPELNGLNGRTAGTVAGFSYSDANKSSGITWGEAVFKEYISNPRAKVPGTKMIFPGIKSQAEIDNLWAYVSQFDKDGKKQ